jgi:acetylornithine/succinyldiaminopimelate/putrescine aminotransferase
MDFDPSIFLNHIGQTSTTPLMIPIERAEGTCLYGPQGKRYLDLISGIGVSNIGHRHPHVVNAIKAQLDKHLHVMVFGEYIQSAPNMLAGELVKVLPRTLDCIYYVNSGTEANEGALKLAKRATGRTEIISCKGAYHGSTHGALSVSGNETKKQAFRPLLPDVRFIEFGKMEDIQLITHRSACVIMETIQGDAGVRIPTREYMKMLRLKCDEAGVLLILDEIQCGMGRTGTLFAFERFDIVPDILTVAKAFGGGLPLGAFIANKKIMSLLTHDPMLGHITTFGGNPVCCASALATLQVIQRENLLDAVEAKGKKLEQRLQHTAIKSVRRVGLMFAIDFDSAERVQKIVAHALENGVILFWFLSCPASLRMAPPLTISDAEIEEAADLILEAVDKAI